MGGHPEMSSNERIGRIVAGCDQGTQLLGSLEILKEYHKEAVLLVITTRWTPSYIKENLEEEPVQWTRERVTHGTYLK